MRFLLVAIIACATTVLGLLIYFYFAMAPRFNESMVARVLFHPDVADNEVYQTKQIDGVALEPVQIDNGRGGTNFGWYLKPREAKYVLLFSHGNAGNITNRIYKIGDIARAGVGVLIYDYSGYGRSSGSPSLSNMVHDAVAAYDYLKDRRKIDPSHIVFYGESLGGGITSELTKFRRPAAIILESTFVSPEVFAKEKIGFMNLYPSALFFEPTLNNAQMVQTDHPPLLIIYGAKDDIIPPTHSQRLFENAKQPKRLLELPDSSHNYTEEHDRVLYPYGIKGFVKSLAP